jgi:hypothetical protein
LLKQKVGPKVAIVLGCFILSKNHNNPTKVAQSAKNCPIGKNAQSGHPDKLVHFRAQSVFIVCFMNLRA